MNQLPALAAQIPSAPTQPVPIWQKTGEFFLNRRVRITALVFAALVVEDALEGLRPHGLESIRDWKAMAGLALVMAGLALRSWAAGILHKKSILTTSGPYGVVRHPLYIGSYAMMLGFCELIDDAENIWFILGPILALYIYRAIAEERTLAEKFGEQWDAYAQKVPRFFPRRWPQDFLRHWSRDQWTRNGEYNAVAAVLLGLVAVEIWHLW